MSEVLLHRTIEQLEEIAASKGLVVVIPEGDELFLDIDSKYSPVAMKVWSSKHRPAIKALEDNGIGIVSNLVTVSQHGKQHIYLKLSIYPATEFEDGDGEFPDRRYIQNPLTPQQRVALQACLGSDPVREVLSLLRSEAWDCPTALFETPLAAAMVEKWRANR